MTHQIKSKSAKSSDREKKAEGLSDYINKKLLEEHSLRCEYLTYRQSQCVFYVKKDYRKYDDISADDINAAQRESEDLPGIPVTEDELTAMNESFPVDSGEAPREYFLLLRSLPGKLLLRGSTDNNHWKSPVYATAFKGVDPSCFECDDVEDYLMDVDILGNSDATSSDAVESHNISGLGAGPCGASEVIEGKSSYQVPSEMVDDDSEEVALGTVSFTDLPGKRIDAYHDFMPFYQENTKLVDATGEDGIAITEVLPDDGIGTSPESHEKNGDVIPTAAAGMQSGPQISNKRVSKRKKMVCSPSK
eukprot:scaffold3881_cov83-Skeletonema_dohrnii-CCMP3373.AAC.2